MSAYPTPRFVKAGGVATSPHVGIDVDKWTEDAAHSLKSLSIASTAGARGTSVSLAIDLDEKKESVPPSAFPKPDRPKRKLLRRDSLDRREALLRGKEGSRRRTRWENDRLLNNPWAQPPLPSDWEVHPTYPRHAVPYYLAPLWDQGLAARAEVEKTKQRKKATRPDVCTGPATGKVPKELRQRFKKSKAARGLLHNLEEQVRSFVTEGSESPDPAEGRAQNVVEPDLSDEEIVFVGRNGKMKDMPPSPKFGDGEDSDTDQTISPRRAGLHGRERLVLESSVSDRSASFGRWLVHIIAAYYGLRTWSRTTGNPARREAYIGLPQIREPRSSDLEHGGIQLPQPLWALM